MATAGGGVLKYILDRLRPAIDAMAEEEVSFLDKLPDRWIPLAIVASAGGSLALELAIIRWQATVWEIFAFYKNFGLLSCFLGLGLGYSLAKRDRILSVMILPLFTLQTLLLVLRHGMKPYRLISLKATPIVEQLNMGLATASDPAHYVAIYFFLGTVMLLTALCFIPVGQVCGRLLERTKQLRAYGFNLLGSVIGVVLVLVLSFLWTPPTIWFLPCLLIFVLLQASSLRSVLIGLITTAMAVTVLTWPVSLLNERIYSPYQLLERGRGSHGHTVIRAAGHYYQRVLDLSLERVNADNDLKQKANYYELPFRLHPKARRVAIVGSGTGNDVAAALRRGVAHVDAIDIDPAIIRIGKVYHPEQPYQDHRVNSIVNDARSFLRGEGKNSYDMIIYGLLDSHTLLSQSSNVRLDSFVYTVEGFREARDRLLDDGVVSLSFCVISPEIGRKIYLMMEEASELCRPNGTS
jgi:hypothetical protein